MRLLALAFFVLLFPVYLIIGLLIFLSMGGPIIFKQSRVGFQQQPFTIFKFRTMADGTITPIGKVLRKLGLDELPQLINIIEGDMSFIGPRPLTAEDITRLGWTTPTHTKRWEVKPGITGLAQLSRVCSAEVSLNNDLHYVQHKSLGLDLKIFFRSVAVPFIGKGPTDSLPSKP